MIVEKRFPSGISETRWVKLVPIKVNVLAWKIKTEAIPTRFNISRRGISIVSLTCPICECGVESTSHLFFECSMARQLARKVSRWWNVGYSDVNSYDEWLKWIVSLRLTSKIKLMIEGVFYVMWWSIWSYRNKLLFDDKPPQKASIFDNIVSNSFYWCKFRSKASFSWNDWLKNPNLVLM